MNTTNDTSIPSNQSENSPFTPPFLNNDHWFLHVSDQGNSWRYGGQPVVEFQPVIFIKKEGYLLSLDNIVYPEWNDAQMAALTFIRKKLKGQLEVVGGIASWK